MFSLILYSYVYDYTLISNKKCDITLYTQCHCHHYILHFHHSSSNNTALDYTSAVYSFSFRRSFHAILLQRGEQYKESKVLAKKSSPQSLHFRIILNFAAGISI